MILILTVKLLIVCIIHDLWCAEPKVVVKVMFECVNDTFEVVKSLKICDIIIDKYYRKNMF